MTIPTTPIPPQPEHLTHPKYRPDIDGLRAIAVLSVVIYHAFPKFIRGGFIGVDIFFVISGFLISTIIMGSLERNSFSFIEFYSRRIKRIFPALLLVLIASFVFGWFALLADEYKQLGKHIAGVAGFISNFLFWNESGYFDNSAETKPLLHLWSLGIEEQYYIVWPLLLWLAWGKRFNLLTSTIVVAVISFALNISKVHGDAVATFYSPQTRFWELLTGSALAYMTLHRRSIFPKLKHKLDMWLGQMIYAQAPETNGKTLHNVQSVFGAALILTGLLVITKERHFPGWWAVLPTLGAVLIISAGVHSWFNRVVLSNRVLVWFGLISFPLYLWHWPLLSFARIIESETPSRQIRIVAVLTSIALAWLTYRLVEKPIRFGNHRKAKTIMLFLLMLVVGCLGYYCFKKDGLEFRQSVQNGSISAKVNDQFVGPLWKYTKNDICLNKYPLENTKNYGWWFCMASKDEKPTLILLGNSYSNQFYPGLSKNINFKHHSILSIGTCDAAWVDESKIISEVNTSPCAGNRPLLQQQFINDIVEKSGSVKFAILGSLSGSLDENYILRLKKRIDFLEMNNVKVIIFTPHIMVDYDTTGCFSRPLKKPKFNCELTLMDYAKHLDRFKPLVQQLSKTNPNVAFFNQNELFCDANKCSMIRNGMPLFRDEFHHLSEYGSVELSNIFEKWAKINTPQIFE